ncbi:MAG: GAF domain-containing protein [Candidatus Sulfotelmatobacter sp.]
MSEQKDKPVFDETTLAKLLEAAYVVQEHNRKLPAQGLRVEHRDLPDRDLLDKESPSPQAPSIPARTENEGNPSQPATVAQRDYTSILAEIIETQHQIQSCHLEVDPAIALVAERAAEITGAAGAAIAVANGNRIRYKAAAGAMSLPAGTEIPMEKALCRECLRTGQVVRCVDVNSASPVDAKEFERRGIRAMIAVPVYHVGDVAGSLELYYASQHAFTEQDVHTCQLMAGLVTEALARNEELNWKKSFAGEHEVMRQALEKLKPQLAALGDTPAGKGSSAKTAAPAPASETCACRKCGHELLGAEQFCGHCGAPRTSDPDPAVSHLQPVLQENAATTPTNGTPPQPRPRTSVAQARPEKDRPEKTLAASIEEEMPELFAAPGLRITEAPLPAELPKPAVGAEIGKTHEAGPALSGEISEDGAEEPGSPSAATSARREPPSAWTSAASAREFLDQLAADKPPGALARFWHSRRGDFYLAIAVILVACVIRWGIWSNHSVGATASPATAAAAHRKPAPNSDLSLFDRMLVSLGLAEAPEPPAYKGNPQTQVWVDLHTALYYCPGTDLYGKTPKGKFTTQRDAQLDQFEPAYQKACD